MGKEIFNGAMDGEKKDGTGRIIVAAEFEQSVTMAEKLDTLNPILADDDKAGLEVQPRASVLAFSKI